MRNALFAFLLILNAVAPGGACRAAEEAPTAPGIVLPVAVARSFGVAPLGVFFDASGTTDAAVTATPFHDVEYRWDFGDGDAGEWDRGTSASSRNLATGPVAGHIYEKPGDYTATLTAFDGVSTASKTIAIHVDDPDVVFAGSRTACLSNKGVWAGCPEGARHYLGSDAAFLISAALSAGSRRILMNRGDTFTVGANQSVAIAVPGPGILGAYGTGSPPVLSSSAGRGLPGSLYATVVTGGAAYANVRDWRFMDFAIVNATPGDTRTDGFASRIAQTTVLRVSITGTNSGITHDYSGLDHWVSHGQRNHSIQELQQLFVHDSAINRIDSGGSATRGSGGGCGFFGVLLKASIQGNHFNDASQAEHGLRATYASGAVIGHNLFEKAAGTKHLIKVHAPFWTGSGGGLIPPGTYSQNLLIADNVLTANATGNPWLVALAPQNSGADERMRAVIVERNLFNLGGHPSSVGLLIAQSDVSVRNNLFVQRNNVDGYAVNVSFHAPVMHSSQVRILHNSVYSASTAAWSGFRVADAEATDIVIRNNLVFAPSSTGAVVAAAGTGTVASNNSPHIRTNPNFSGMPPAVPGDFRPKRGSHAAGGGKAVAVWSDFQLTRLLAVRDLGAFALPAAAR